MAASVHVEQHAYRTGWHPSNYGVLSDALVCTSRTSESDCEMHEAFITYVTSQPLPPHRNPHTAVLNNTYLTPMN